MSHLENGLFLGLDRIPEVKTARSKIDAMAASDVTAQWAKEMSSFWVQRDEELAGVLYSDDHVRTYSAYKTKLPARFQAPRRPFLNTIRMIAYRAEVTLVVIIREHLNAMTMHERWLKSYSPTKPISYLLRRLDAHRAVTSLHQTFKL